MKYLSWQSLQSWACLGCGVCCYRYIVKLNDIEIKAITDLFPDGIMEKEGTIYLRKHEGACVFLMDGLCGLQPLGLKPLACKVWPFYISSTPLDTVEDEDYKALFLWHGQERFIYVNTFCKGLNKNITPNIRGIVKEVITVYSDPQLKQYYSTSRHSLNEDLHISIQEKLQSIVTAEGNSDNGQSNETVISKQDELVLKGKTQLIHADRMATTIKPVPKILKRVDVLPVKREVKRGKASKHR